MFPFLQQLAFRSVTNSISSKRDQIRRILQLPPPHSIQEEDSKQPQNSEENTAEPAVKDLEEAITAYLRRATETFDLSKNVEVTN